MKTPADLYPNCVRSQMRTRVINSGVVNLFTDIIEVRNDGIFTIGFDRPSRKNAMTDAMYQHLAEVLTEANERPDVQVILLHGLEDTFSSGNDIEDFVKRPASENMSRSSGFMKSPSAAFSSPFRFISRFARA